jgi:hypothetical protein
MKLQILRSIASSSNTCANVSIDPTLFIRESVRIEPVEM